MRPFPAEQNVHLHIPPCNAFSCLVAPLRTIACALPVLSKPDLPFLNFPPSRAGEWFEKAAAQRKLADSLPDTPPAPVDEKPKKGAPKKGAKDEPPPPSAKQIALAKAKELEENPIVDFERQLVGGCRRDWAEDGGQGRGLAWIVDVLDLRDHRSD